MDFYRNKIHLYSDFQNKYKDKYKLKTNRWKLIYYAFSKNKKEL